MNWQAVSNLHMSSQDPSTGRSGAVLASGHANTSSHHNQDRTAQLEQKLDNLVNLLTTQAQTQQPPAQARSSGGSPAYLRAQATVPSHLTSSSGNTPVSHLRCGPASSPLDEDYLTQFRNVHLQSCPFIYIPPEIR